MLSNIKMELYLQSIYEKTKNLEDFILLSSFNYDPDKNLLYKILEFLNNKTLIKRSEIDLIYNIIKKILIKDNYDKSLKYFESAVKIKNYDIIELLITNKVKIYEDEICSLKLDKNLLL